MRENIECVQHSVPTPFALSAEHVCARCIEGSESAILRQVSWFCIKFLPFVKASIFVNPFTLLGYAGIKQLRWTLRWVWPFDTSAFAYGYGGHSGRTGG